MVKMTLAEALEKIRQGCTELSLYGACRGAPPHPCGTATLVPVRGACGAPPERTPHALAAPTVRAPPRAAGCRIGDEGAKALAAALETNTTLTKLYLYSACSGAPPHPRGTAACAHACRWACGAPPRAFAARARRAHSACAPACRRR